MAERARTVLWGARRGDVQYGSREFWRRNLRVGLPTLEVDNAAGFDVGMLLLGDPRRDEVLEVDSIEGPRLAFVRHLAVDWAARS